MVFFLFSVCRNSSTKWLKQLTPIFLSMNLVLFNVIFPNIYEHKVMVNPNHSFRLFLWHTGEQQNGNDCINFRRTRDNVGPTVWTLSKEQKVIVTTCPLSEEQKWGNGHFHYFVNTKGTKNLAVVALTLSDQENVRKTEWTLSDQLNVAISLWTLSDQLNVAISLWTLSEEKNVAMTVWTCT